MPRILTKREKLILSITIGVIMFSVVFNFVIAGIFKKNDALNKEISFTRAKLKKYLQLLSQREYLQNKYSSFTSTFNSAQSSAQEGVTLEPLAELENFAKDASIRIIDIRPKATVKNYNLYKEIFIDLRTEGEIKGYLKFIYNIENSLSLLRIKRLQFTAKPNTQVLEGSLSISQISLTE